MGWHLGDCTGVGDGDGAVAVEPTVGDVRRAWCRRPRGRACPCTRDDVRGVVGNPHSLGASLARTRMEVRTRRGVLKEGVNRQLIITSYLNSSNGLSVWYCRVNLLPYRGGTISVVVRCQKAYV